jgi:YD repeat-containing protein
MSALRRLVVLTVVVAALLPAARAADVEEREFVTLLDGRRVGDYHMKISQKDDGSVVLNSQGQMHFTHPGGVARYRYSGSEVWREGQLVRLDSTSGDDTKETTVSATAERDGLRVLSGHRERLVNGPAWPTTYWRLPPAEVRGQTLTLLDADTGRALHGTLERIGTGQVVIQGRPVSCLRYRLTGGGQVDLWYDAQERLVRQEWSQDGRHVVLELTQVKR